MESASAQTTAADVELGRWLYAAWRHLSEYSTSAAAKFPSIGYVGRAADLLGRLRGLEDYPYAKVEALALHAGIDRQQLSRVLLPGLETLGTVSLDRDRNGNPARMRALVLGEDDVMARAAALWRSFDPSPEERGAVAALRMAADLPLTPQEAVAGCISGADLSEEEAARAVELAEAHGFVRRSAGAESEDFFFNEFLWGENIERTRAALASLPSEQRDAMRSLLEELHGHEGRPLKEIESAAPDLVRTAIVHGLIESTEVRTTDGKLEYFAFTPRFRGFGVTKGQAPDALSQVRLVMASFGFATRYARFRLSDPERFLSSLIDRGYAGDATPIGTDYGAMVMQRIVDVEPTSGARFRFKAIKTDTLDQALDSMRAGGLLRAPGNSRGDGLFDQNFTEPIAARLRLGRQADRTPLWDQDLLSAVRDSAHGESFGVR